MILAPGQGDAVRIGATAEMAAGNGEGSAHSRHRPI